MQDTKDLTDPNFFYDLKRNMRVYPQHLSKYGHSRNPERDETIHSINVHRRQDITKKKPWEYRKGRHRRLKRRRR